MSAEDEVSALCIAIHAVLADAHPAVRASVLTMLVSGWLLDDFPPSRRLARLEDLNRLVRDNLASYEATFDD